MVFPGDHPIGLAGSLVAAEFTSREKCVYEIIKALPQHLSGVGRISDDEIPRVEEHCNCRSGGSFVIDIGRPHMRLRAVRQENNISTIGDC